MKIKTFILGDYQTNCYCLTADGAAKDCLIIDTGLQSDPLIDYLKTNQLNPVAAGGATAVSSESDLITEIVSCVSESTDTISYAPSTIPSDDCKYTTPPAATRAFTKSAPLAVNVVPLNAPPVPAAKTCPDTCNSPKRTGSYLRISASIENVAI